MQTRTIRRVQVQKPGMPLLFIFCRMFWLVFVAAACSSTPITPAAIQMPPDSESGQSAPAGEVSAVIEGIATSVAQRTPVPTATPGPVEQVVAQVAEESGLAESTFLGLTAADWINLLVSILYIVVGYLLGAWLLLGLFKWIVQRTPTRQDDIILKRVERLLKLLVLIVVGRPAYKPVSVDFLR